MKNIIPVIIIGVIAGCATLQGGMPPPPFDFDSDLKKIKYEFKDSADISKYYANQTKESRNKFVSARLVLINIEYLRYVKMLTQEESLIHAATDILVLSLDIASTAFNPASTKTVLSAISSSIGGARLAIDENFYQKKTTPVLIAAMNAERKKVLVAIIDGISKELSIYSFEQAYSDVNDYYLAGTLQGALNAIQKDSGKKEIKAENDIKILLDEKEGSYLEKVNQELIEKILIEVDKLKADAAYDLNKNPPVKNEEVEKVVMLRDPEGKRFKDVNVGKMIIKMRVALSKRSPENLKAWEAAIKANQ